MKFIYLLALLFSSAVFASDFMERYIDETSKIEKQRISNKQKETNDIINERRNLEKELKKLQANEKIFKKKKDYKIKK